MTGRAPRCRGARRSLDQRLASRSSAAAVGALPASGAVGAAPGASTVQSSWPGIGGVLEP